MDSTTYGLDIAKNVMQLHWVDAETGEIGRKKLARAKLAEYFAKLRPARVVMEACGSAHHWARVLGKLGHEVELLPAAQVRPFVRSNKDDAADARAIWLAAQHRDIRRVPQKSTEQQAVLALHRTRSHWISVRTATMNALRGLLYEFGVVLRGGRKAGLKALSEQRAQIDEQLPQVMRALVDGQLQTLSQVQQRIDQLEHEIAAVQKQLSKARELRQVPGIGVLGSTALAATLGDGRAWRSGREFSASLGLVPAHSGTGGKVHTGHISKRGDSYLRTLLIHGARSVIEHAKDKPKWLQQMLARRPPNVVVVALANKMARTAWALVAHGRAYQRDWQSAKPGCSTAQAAAA
ncbi:IS110 family transposase [Hydrogenophaga pseudoflava]|jgi:transposase|uniref:IS110 family transposase n=1 Tax=Hydrogenophaga pseudoflava TaxID=47421 RepID=UPI0027E44EAE|nr:IS110 family transposase [Hydrogenophaga pseudoflava]MDQ7746882.1 IS110 family transposase [Hydrogenophaga pseudoflava]